jgi:glutaredoxin
MVRVFGAEWCTDTGRTSRVLRRMGVPHVCHDVDADPAALQHVLALQPGRRRTPLVLVGDVTLVEPSTRELLVTLVGAGALRPSDMRARWLDYNLGDLERVVRLAAGTAAAFGATRASGTWRAPLGLVSALLILSGTRGWCPFYHELGVSSRGGPGDHPADAERAAWLAPTSPFPPRSPGGALR